MNYIINPLISGALCAFLFVLIVRINMRMFRGVLREKKLKKLFEHLPYTEDNIHLIHTVVALLRENLGIADVHIVINSDEGFLETVYCTQENRANHIRVAAELFTPYIIGDGTILLKETIHRNSEIFAVCKKCDAEILIILHNKEYLLALLFLGPQKNKINYSRADLDCLSALYPYLYVFAYYLKNIAFQPLANVVSKEILFSEEVIQSIQANVDDITYPNVDCAAHNSPPNSLYGAYADVIPLTASMCLITVGDFNRRGLSVCMSMVILKTLVRFFAQKTPDLKKIIIRIHGLITQCLPKGTQFSGIFMLCDFKAGLVHYADCGISSLLMYNLKSGTVKEMHKKSAPLGAGSSEQKVAVYGCTLQPGTVILAGTGEMHERDYINKYLTGTVLPSREIIRRLYESYALTDQSPQRDSCAVLLQILPS